MCKDEEIAKTINEKPSAAASCLFNNLWWSYPRAIIVICDDKVISSPTLSHHARSMFLHISQLIKITATNGMLECIHAAISGMIWTSYHDMQSTDTSEDVPEFLQRPFALHI